MDIYWERQTNPNLCTLSALNAFFEENYISEIQYKQMCNLYCQEYPGNNSSKPAPFTDYNVPSNHMTIINYILGFHNIKCEYLPMCSYGVGNDNNLCIKKASQNVGIEKYVGKSDWIFVFNQGHTWGMRKRQNKWYRVDSQSGISETNLNSILDPNLGVIIPRSKDDLIILLKKKQDFIRTFLKEKNIDNMSKFQQFIQKQLEQGYPIGDLEIPVFVFSELISKTPFHNDKIHSLYKSVQDKLNNSDGKKDNLSYDLYILINTILMETY